MNLYCSIVTTILTVRQNSAEIPTMASSAALASLQRRFESTFASMDQQNAENEKVCGLNTLCTP